VDMRMKIKKSLLHLQMSGAAKNPQIAALQSALEQLAKGSPAPLSLGSPVLSTATVPPSSGAIQAMFTTDPNPNPFNYPETYGAPRGQAPYGYFGTRGLGQGQIQNHTRAKGGVFIRIIIVILVVVIVLVILGRFSIGPLAGKVDFLEGTMFGASQRYVAPVSDATRGGVGGGSSNSSSGLAIPFAATAAATPPMSAEYASAGGVVLPTHLPPTAQREDLVRYAREQAAYYAAQGVPQQEALAYISQQLQGAMSAQATRALSSGGGDGENFQDMEAMRAEKPLIEQAAPTTIDASASVGTVSNTVSKQPILPPQLPLVMPLTGIVPLSLPRARESTGLFSKPAATSFSAEDEGQVDDRKMARKHKVSSESKEVQDYMKRRQQALGVEEGSDVADDNARATEVTKVTKDGARNMGTGSGGTFVDPQETLL